MTTKHERLRRALSGLAPLDRVPVWFMRQAGRYLPEYRAVRQRASFLDLCGSAELACEVTIQPIDRFDLDAAIVFSDILVVPQAMGVPVRFDEGHGPQLQPIGPSEVSRLLRPDVATALPTAPATIRAFRAARPDVPILGFAGAPWTLLCYLAEGGGSKDWARAKAWLASDPASAQALLDLLADVVGDHLQQQVEAGAAAVQIFDTWAGALDADDFRRFAAPAMARALARVRGAPRIVYTKDAGAFLPWLPECGGDVVGLDWRADAAFARHVLGPVPLQGNLDPDALHAPAEAIRRKVHAILAGTGGVGHVFNLGHGVKPSTPIEGVQSMIDAVHDFVPVSA